MNTHVLLQRLMTLRDQAVAFAEQHPALESLDPEHRASARNLLHYISLRRHELRDIQQSLIERGLTSLGILESHTLMTLNNVIAILQQLDGEQPDTPPEAPVTVEESNRLLERRTENLFGKRPVNRDVRIMVTLPAEAGDSPVMIENLLNAGMNVMRINCAHDEANAWKRMIANLRHAEARTGKHCKIQLDLAGPKLRTGRIAPAGRVLKVKPERDLFGRVHVPGRFWLVPAGEDHEGHVYPSLELSGDVLMNTRPGDSIQLKDARDASREFHIVAEHQDARLVESDHTAYLQENTRLTFKRNGSELGKGSLINVDQVVQPITLRTGDSLVLTRADSPGHPGESSASGAQIQPARIHCTLAEAFSAVKPGHRVWFDDGKIGGVVSSRNRDEIEVRISHTPPGGAKLRAEKGINFPDTEFRMPALTTKDIADLEAMAGEVDMVALSFVRSPQDLEALQTHLQGLGVPQTGVILKIENRAAFENLPEILLTAMRSPTVGVMIARGDLAVEIGFERLSEVQEEILWLCEAAHTPVIWATQILESLAKKGAPSRAEISDAAMSIQAECTMLNKGPNIVETVRFLDGLLQRMEGHYHKRRLMMRPLQVCVHRLASR